MAKKGRERNGKAEGKWKRLMKEWEGSGESMRTFCRRRRISEASMHRWKRELKLREREEEVRQRTQMVPVEIEKMGTMESGVEVEARSGHRIRVGVGFNEETLRQVLASLEA
jgi:hypothetical protein